MATKTKTKAKTQPERLHYTGNDEADRLIAKEPFALLMGFALDQQVPVPTAFSGPLKLKQRLGTIDPRKIARTDPAKVEAAFREKPAIHRFPANMARRVQEIAAIVSSEYGGDAGQLWNDAADGPELRRRLSELPGFGDMTIKSLSAVLAKRFDVAAARELAPKHPTLGDVDSPEALERYQAMKREHKARLKAQRQ
ncbi:MAG TPA: HhH-GPD-type base excision DNA repair protein [Gaiellaceae bacterium]|nr:HhH-GPD-type base excision DNA repair protein [Gaiellaceae bacterium]